MNFHRGLKRGSIVVGIILGIYFGGMICDDYPGAPWYVNISLMLVTFFIPFVVVFAIVQILRKVLEWVIAGFLDNKQK